MTDAGAGMKLGLCVVGCGQFAHTFAGAIQSLRHQVDLYFASRDRERARAYCDMYQGSGFFGAYQEAAADPKVQAMYICTPHHLHLKHAAMAAQAGKHILVEKPIARTLEEAREIIAAAEGASVNLMVAENYRFMSTVRKCRELVADNAIGTLRLIQLQEEAPFQPGQWRISRATTGGGVFIDGGIHKVHMLLYLAGMPEHIFAARLPQALSGVEGEDGLVLMTRSVSGAVGLINHSWTISPSPRPRWASISGTQGHIYFELDSPLLQVSDARGEKTLRLPEDHRGLLPMVQEFLASIQEQRQPEMSGATGLQDLAVVLKAYESMEVGASLPLG